MKKLLFLVCLTLLSFATFGVSPPKVDPIEVDVGFYEDLNFNDLSVDLQVYNKQSLQSTIVVKSDFSPDLSKQIYRHPIESSCKPTKNSLVRENAGNRIRYLWCNSSSNTYKTAYYNSIKPGANYTRRLRCVTATYVQ